MFNRVTIAPLVALAFAVLAYFKIGLPETVTQDSVVAAVMLVLAAVTGIARFAATDPESDAKAWYLSRVIWTQIISALVAVLLLAGISIGLPIDTLAEVALAVAAGISALFGFGPQQSIGK